MRKKERTGNVRKILWMVLALLVLTPYIGLYAVKCWYDDKINDIANARFIIVDKEKLQLHLMDYQGNEEKTYGVCCGKNYGNKQVIGDMKTPEGIFHITDIEDATTKRSCRFFKQHDLLVNSITYSSKPRFLPDSSSESSFISSSKMSSSSTSRAIS